MLVLLLIQVSVILELCKLQYIISYNIIGQVNLGPNIRNFLMSSSYLYVVFFCLIVSYLFIAIQMSHNITAIISY